MEDRRIPGEFELIDRLVRLLPDAPDELVVGPGDDCAAVRIGEGRLQLLTCDSMVEARHFSRLYLGPHDLGRRLAAVNLSDVAAMGGRPLYALVSLVMPRDEAEAWTAEVARGAAEELSRRGAHLVGGNLSASAAGVMADMTLVGEVEEDRILLRSGARAGDAILVTGHLGSSAAGLGLLGESKGWQEGFDELARAHILPTPRLREGRYLAASGACTAAIDLSDGLASDLGHVCRASGSGAEVNVATLPTLEATRRAAELLDRSLESFLLSGGEDYELLFTAPADCAEELAAGLERETGTPVARIGTMLERSDIRYVDGDGAELPPPQSGWDHFRS